MVTMAGSDCADDPAMLADLWPMLVTAALDPSDRQRWAIDQAVRKADEPVASLLRSLADQYQREGGLTADFSYTPAFAAAVDRARELARTGRDAEAFDAILDALPS
jgi:hypothetical protein